MTSHPPASSRRLGSVGAATAAAPFTVFLALSIVLSGPAEATPTLRYTADQAGDFALVGNTGGFDCEAGVPAPVVGTTMCSAQQNTSSPDLLWRSEDLGAGQATASAAVTPARSRTTAMLVLPAGAKVTYARLYWAGVRSGNQNDTSVIVERPGAFTQTVVGDGAVDVKYPDHPSVHYQATADVTKLVAAQGPGSYRVSDIDTVNIFGFGHHRLYVSWSLVVFYQLDGEPQRNLTLFDGLDLVEAGKGAAVELRGFLVPVAGFDAKLGVVAYEGDAPLVGDSLAVNGQKLSGPLNPVDNFFNATRTWLGAGVSNAGDVPQLTGGPASMGGIDLDVVDIKPYVKQGDVSAKLEVTTSSDNFILGLFVTSIATFKPNFTATYKTFKNLANRPGGGVRTGDVIEYTITTTNTGNDVGTGIVMADVLPEGLSYVPNSLRVTTGANVGAKTDGAGDDQGEYDAATRTLRVRLGAGATGTQPGSMAIGGSSAVVFRASVNEGPGGMVANQAVLTAAGAAGAPPQPYPSDGNGLDVGAPPTTFTVESCTTNAECKVPRPICLATPEGRLCVECGANTDCPAARPYCEQTTHTCRACIDNANCPAATPICDAATLTCRGCTSDGQCPRDKPSCLPNGACGGCQSNADCSGATPICNSGLCVARPDGGADVPDALGRSSLDASTSGGADGGVDGGVEIPLRVSGGGCQCTLSPQTPDAGSGAWLVAPLALVLLARRRRRR